MVAIEPERLPAWVAVIPVRMQEAWLLFDEAAIRRAADNPAGRTPLGLPPLTQCEGLPDPKALLHEILREASGLGARRREKMNVSRAARRIPDFIGDFTPLRCLPAFATLEADIGEAIQRNSWNRLQ
jgi:hypothetical protein